MYGGLVSRARPASSGGTPIQGVGGAVTPVAQIQLDACFRDINGTGHVLPLWASEVAGEGHSLFSASDLFGKLGVQGFIHDRDPHLILENGARVAMDLHSGLFLVRMYAPGRPPWRCASPGRS